MNLEILTPEKKLYSGEVYGVQMPGISGSFEVLEKQKEGKKRMRQIGNVEVPQEAFLAVLKLDE